MRKPRPIWTKRFALAPSLVLGVLCLVLSIAVHAETLIVALGASNVAGKGVSSAQAWPAQLEGMLRAKGYDVRIKNAGKSGDTTAGMLHRLTFAVPSSTKIVILDMGGGYYNNRKLTSASQARGHADMEEIQANLKSRGIEIVHWLSREPINLRQADKIHLTAEGHRAVAQELEPKVIQALKSLGG